MVHALAHLATLLNGMASWPGREDPVTQLHQGDLGWHLRLPDDAIADAFHGWWDGEDLLAVALVEGVLGRFVIAPGHEHDRDLAVALADVARALSGDRVYADVDPASATWALLADDGWSPDPDPWVALHADLATWSPTVDVAGLRVVEAAEAVADRVAVQRAGFEGSTFTEDAWHRMAAAPGYRRDLDLVVTTPDGTPAAIATAWYAGRGATAILEPVATHRDLRGQGWGVRAVTAVTDRLRGLGASGVSVQTPQEFVAAVATYRSAGLSPVRELRGLELVREGQSTT